MRDIWSLNLLYREWMANRFAHMIVIGVLALALLMYGLYGVWSQDVGTEGHQAQSPGVPVPLLVHYPDWAARMSRPHLGFERLTDDAHLDSVTRDVAIGVVTRLRTPVGTVEAWGVDLQYRRLTGAFDLLQGRLPEAGQREVALSAGLVDELNMEPGDSLPLGYLHPDLGEYLQGEFRISGIVNMSGPLDRTVVGDRLEIGHLAYMRQANAAWIWQRGVGAVRHSSTAMRALRDVLPRVRAPAYPASYAAEGEDIDDNRWLSAYGGLPSPFMHRVEPAYWYAGVVSDRIAAMGKSGAITVSGLVSLMFLVVALALTLTVMVIVLDRQRVIGTYAVVGMSAEDIGRMFRSQLIADSVIGTVLGIGLLSLVLAAGEGGSVTEVPVLTLILWVVLQAALVCWGGRVAWVLSGSRDLRAHLRGDTGFDWWALIDVWPEPVGAKEVADHSRV